MLYCLSVCTEELLPKGRKDGLEDRRERKTKCGIEKSSEILKRYGSRMANDCNGWIERETGKEKGAGREVKEWSKSKQGWMYRYSMWT